MSVDTVLFDLGGVVCRFRPERRLAALAAACGRTPEEVERSLYGGGIIDAADEGELDRAGLEDRLRAALGLAVSRAELERLWASAFTLDAEVIALVRRLSPDVTLGLLTNNDVLLMEALPMHFPEISDVFDGLAFSGALGTRKPAAEAYHRALTMVGAEAARTLFIDDSEGNVAGARQAGLTALLFTGGDRLAVDLERMGLLLE